MRRLMALGAALAAVPASAITYGFEDAEALLYDRSNEPTASVLDNRYNGIFLQYYRAVDPVTGIEDPYVPVTAIDYADYQETPVSGRNALDAWLSSTYVYVDPGVFTGPLSFGFTLDNNAFGDANASVRFYDANDVLVDEVALDQTVAGYRFRYTGSFDHALLPSGAYYDDLSVVPEPASFVALAVGAVGLYRRHRR